MPMMIADTAGKDSFDVNVATTVPPVAASVETRRLVEIAIDRLPGVFRAVFVLREVEDMPVEEIAAALESSPDLVRARYLRAKCLVRESIVRRIDGAMEDVFAFAGARCDRIVAGVLARLKESQARGA